jgi:hypothetical protein
VVFGSSIPQAVYGHAMSALIAALLPIIITCSPNTENSLSMEIVPMIVENANEGEFMRITYIALEGCGGADDREPHHSKGDRHDGGDFCLVK